MTAYKYVVKSFESDEIYDEFDIADEAIAYAKEYAPAYVEKVEVELNDFGEVIETLSVERIYPEGMTPEEEAQMFAQMEKEHEDELLVDPYEADEFGDFYTNKHESLDTEKMVEELEENEDEVECKRCFDLFPKEDCIKTEHGYLCKECAKQHESLEATVDQDLNDNRTPHYEEPTEFEEPFVANDMRKHEHAIKESVEPLSDQQLDDIIDDVLDGGLNESVLDEDFKSILKKILRAALMGLAGAGVTLVTANPALGAAASLGVGALTDVAKEVTGEVFDWVEAKKAGNEEKVAEIEGDIEDTAGENKGSRVLDQIKQAWDSVVGNPEAGNNEQIPLFAYESLNEDKSLNEDWLSEYWWEDDDPMNWDDKFGPIYLVYCDERPVGYIEWPYEGREYTPSEERVLAAAKRLFNLADDAAIDYEPVDSDSVDIDLPFHDRTEITEHVQDRPAPIETEQELHGMDNAVVDCQTDMKVIAHSEDEKPLDCLMKKAPLEKPLAEGVSLDNPLLKKGIGYLNRNPSFFGYVCSYRNGKTHQKVLVDKGFKTEKELMDYVNNSILSNRDVVDVEVLRQGDQEKYLRALNEAKKEDDELPPDPNAVKVEVHTMLNDLVADEIEAINGYEEAKQEIMDAPIEHKDKLLSTVDHIEDEEEEHIDELIDAASEIPFDKEQDFEEDPFDQDFDVVEEPEETAVEEAEAPVDESYAGIPFDSEVQVGDKIRIIHLAAEDNSYDGKEGVVEHIDGIGQLHGTWGGLAIIPGVDEFEVITEESLDEDLTPLAKMQAANDGTRRQNWRACSNVKLVAYRDICEKNGLTNALSQIDAEIDARKPQDWESKVDMADKLLDELIKHTHNMDYDDGDGYWLSEYDIWCNRYLYHTNSLHNTADLEIIGDQLAQLVDGLDFYFKENEFDVDPDDEDYDEDELISEIGYTLEK